MALQFSTTARNAMLDSIETSAGTAVKVCLFSGSVPASCATANAGTLLATFTLDSDWAAAASGGTKAFQKGAAALSGSNPYTTTAVAANTAGYFRLFDSTGATVHMQGTVGQGSGDMSLDNTVLANGQTVQITGWTLTAPGA